MVQGTADEIELERQTPGSGKRRLECGDLILGHASIP